MSGHARSPLAQAASDDHVRSAASTPAIAEHPVGAALLVSALGVGDIGTSPIYAFRESLKAANAGTEATVLGVLSLVFWAVILVVALRYVVFVHAGR